MAVYLLIQTRDSKCIWILCAVMFLRDNSMKAALGFAGLS